MSAKQTIDKPDENVDEVADKLTEAAIGEDDAAAKKREKKMRQKAKKEAAKTDLNFMFWITTHGTECEKFFFSWFSE